MLLQLEISCLQEKAAHWRNVDRGRRVREHPTLQAIETFLNLSAVRRSRELGHHFLPGRSAASTFLCDPRGCCGELGAPLMAVSSTTGDTIIRAQAVLSPVTVVIAAAIFFLIATHVSLLGNDDRKSPSAKVRAHADIYPGAPNVAIPALATRSVVTQKRSVCRDAGRNLLVVTQKEICLS